MSDDMFFSLVQSATAPETVDIRDEGQEEVKPLLDAEGKLVLDDDGEPVRAGQAYRPAWPEGMYITIKASLSGDDTRKINKLTYARPKFETDASAPGGQKMSTDYYMDQAPFATAAVMIQGFKCKVTTDENGKLRGVFVDPDTNAILKMPSSSNLQARLEAVCRLPLFIIRFIDSEVQRLNEDPLGRLKAANASETVSGQA